MPASALWLYVAVFLVMMSNLLLELLLTRIFSATMWYHFAFVAVSVALFGTTVGAVIVHLWSSHFSREQLWELAARHALYFAVAIVLCGVVQLHIPVTFGASWTELAELAALYLCAAVPFVFCGIFICLALLGAEDRLGTVYAADLIGAGAACVLFVPFVAHSGGPRGLLVLAALAAAGAAIMAAASERRSWLASVATITSVSSLLVFATGIDRTALQVRWTKGAAEGPHVLEKWNALSRLVVQDFGSVPVGWGLSQRFPALDHTILQRRLVIDGAAVTVLTAFDGDFAKLPHLQWDITALPYVLRPHGMAMVIGVGGGRDILTALSFGSRRVTGVEVNRDIIWLLQDPFADFTGRLAFRPDVALVHDEARSYIARSNERYDVIQASLVDTWAAAANGAYVLSENALYTKEAFRVFLDHLAPGGLLSVSRWYFSAQPGETLRLASLAAAVLRDQGVGQPQERIFLARSGQGHHAVTTLLIGERRFTSGEREALREWCATRDFQNLLELNDDTGRALRVLTDSAPPADLLRRYPLDLTPPTDNRPFFFNMVRLTDAFTADPTQLDLITANVEAVKTLGWLFVIVVALSFVFILGPLWLRRNEARSAGSRGSRLLYFTSLGFGFILIELSQMQRLMITLGHPVYGLTVVLFSLLTAAGLGSLWTRRQVAQGLDVVFLKRILIALLAVAVATAAATALGASAFEGAPTWLRIAGSVLLLTPLGFLLGVPLATGMALCVSDSGGDRALYWGVNGAASVCGSVLATMISLTFGIAATYGVGAAVYATSLLVAARAFRHSVKPSSACETQASTCVT